MTFLSYTVFADLALTTVKQVVNLEGREAEKILASFNWCIRRERGRDACEGDVFAGCRIDRIGSEDVRLAA